MRACSWAPGRGEVPGPAQCPGEALPGEALPVFPGRGEACVSRVSCPLGWGPPGLVLPGVCFTEVLAPAVVCGVRKFSAGCVWGLERACGAWRSRLWVDRGLEGLGRAGSAFCT